MPLLGREPFQRVSLNPNIDPEKEVFFCKTTNEAFESFDAFFERTILCSSMVWTCSVTGKTGLTFEEALTSEETAKSMLNSFPVGLQAPVLFLVKLIEESKFGEIVNLIYAFIANRYFIGEEVLATLNHGKKVKGKIVAVRAPGEISMVHDAYETFGLNPLLYKYDIIMDNDPSETIFTLDPGHIMRLKASVNKEKIRLFLKHHIGAVKRFQNMKLTQEAIHEYNLNSLSWHDIFAGPMPNFPSSEVKKPCDDFDENVTSMASKAFQRVFEDESSKLASKKGSDGNKKPKNSNDKTNEVEIISQKGKPGRKPEMSPEDRQKLIDERKEQKRLEKEKLKELKKQKEQEFHEWCKKRDDLECDDLQPLPPPTRVDCEIPPDHFGDAIMVLEFLHNFGDKLNLKSTFRSGVTFEDIGKMLLERTKNGPFFNTIRLLLKTVFRLIEEDEQTSTNVKSSAKDDEDEDTDVDMSEDESETASSVDDKSDNLAPAMKVANSALALLKQNYGKNLTEITITQENITEVLRLHLSSSGNGPKPRTIHRGWYTSEEDPGLSFVNENPELLVKMESKKIFEYDIEEKLKLLHVLMHQVLSFIPFREHIDNAVVKISEIRKEIRTIQATFTKWEKENAVKRPYHKKEADNSNEASQDSAQGSQDSSIDADIEKSLKNFKREKTKKQTALKNKLRDLRAQLRKMRACSAMKPVGLDRAFRRYWVFQSLPGLFVEQDDPFIGQCHQATPVQQRKRVLEEFEKEFQNFKKLKDGTTSSTTSDKENENALDEDGSTNKEQEEGDNTNDEPVDGVNTILRNLDMCSGDFSSCSVHNYSDELHNRWGFYHTPEQIKKLLNSLNARGIRESELRNAIEQDKTAILDSLSKCKVNQFNTNVVLPTVEVRKSSRLRSTVDGFRRQISKYSASPS